MGCIGSRTVGGYRGQARVRGKLAPGRSSGPLPHPHPYPWGPPSVPARPCLAPLLSLHPLRSLYSCALAPPGLPSLSAHCLLSIALPQARSFPGSISTASFLAPSLFPTPDGPIPPPSGHSRVYSAVALSGAAPLLRTSSPASSLTFFCTPPPIFTLFPIWLVCFAPNHFPLGSLFPSLLPPPICFVHVHFPS